MSIFRSEDMHLYKFMTTKDSSYQAIETLGNLQIVDIIDLNKMEQAYNLPF